ncbi:MAG: hypothetical protein KDA57_17125 [Planctomycetales bacterium]|nr:hypothetical protein [Planctomycetales bacterium]
MKDTSVSVHRGPSVDASSGEPAQSYGFHGESVEAFRSEAVRQLELGEPLFAYDLANEGLERWPGDLRLRQLRGIALSRSGAIDAACAEFQTLADEGHTDEETLGNLARTHKANWLANRDSPDARSLLKQAYEGYRDAYQRTAGYWSGINAAALALASGNKQHAIALANEVLAECIRLTTLPGRDSERYWLRATCGEASLIAGRLEEAIQWYRSAAEVSERRYANIASTRNQAKLISELAGASWSELESCFVLPRVVIATGHMIDSDHREHSRFPPGIAEAVRGEIVRKVAGWGPVIGYASAACGADLLFLEVLAETENDAVIVLPFSSEQFSATSVNYAGPGWQQRFESVVQHFGEPVVATSWSTPASGPAFDYANRVMSGLAKLQADLFEVPVTLLAVWDGEQEGELGGTAEFVSRWKEQALPVEHINTRQFLSVTEQEHSHSIRFRSKTKVVNRPNIGHQPQELIAMLFADVQGFSQFTDAQMPAFVSEFLQRVADLMEATGVEPLTTNTWGDGFFATFKQASVVGRFALQLAEMMRATPWEQYGLPADLNIRIALHAGPVYAMRDPITARASFWGAHVSRAARIEPVTPPGQVYASRAFAALARDEEDCDFRCQYVGRTPLAKGYGTFPLYHVADARA